MNVINCGASLFINKIEFVLIYQMYLKHMTIIIKLEIVNKYTSYFFVAKLLLAIYLLAVSKKFVIFNNRNLETDLGYRIIPIYCEI